ncbi:hypothetical protein TRAPUB_373 [Trametes pubescens]|uniref:Uncharacterized protein n=1 Tax=Trametes pubescens TaxID=154538 RepID=A0A1M2VMH9_TRAPU|nr:hypothetical protein TRAPUB_373 [Trametes pubescens]
MADVSIRWRLVNRKLMTYPDSDIAARGSVILVDSLAIAVTWYQTRAVIQVRTSILKRPSLEQVMWENALNTKPLYSITSSLNSRFLLALHETNTRLEGGDTSISSLSFNTGSSGDQRAGSPKLPEFLGVIGGPIHSFHDGEEDMESLEFAPTSQEEHQTSESEGEVLESGGDGGNLA